MGIVSDSDFELEDNRLSPKPKSNPNPNAQVIDLERGRGIGNVEVPNALRNIIGDTAITDGRQDAVALANNFGISPSSASAYAQGATSTASYHERPNTEVLNKTRTKITKIAHSKLIKSLRAITEDKLESAKARDLAGIAKDMSAVVRNMEPEKETNTNTNNGPTFVFYSPQFKKEEHFDVVPSKE